MKKLYDAIIDYKAGIFFCLMILASVYFVVAQPLINGPCGISDERKLIIVIAWVILVCMILFSKGAKQNRINMWGSSNIFVALFKKEKKK
jgi:uncharacterized membrane protein